MAQSNYSAANSCNDTPNDGAIAIIGMALRFADEVDSPRALWEYLVEKRSAMGSFPKSRWNQAAHSGHSAPNMLPQKGGHFMSGDPAAFDGPFFSISPLEIASMDPQQRMSLECSYQAIENAGLSLSAVAGTDTSVYVGVSSHDYEAQLARDPDVIEKYRATGTNTALLANRVSWFLDLRGPSMAVDTACSSTMNAIHLACQSIRSGESTTSLAGGANIILQVDAMMALHSLGMLSHNSISRSFDANADGFARGEGVGFVVLKRFSDAVRDGNTIRAVIRANCANQDGHTPSIVQPSSIAQQELIQLAYKNLDMKVTRYFESHGTGTRLGDSLEATAINSVFKPTIERPLFVGAAKSNFGHLEAASGILSVIKTVLVLEHGVIPPNAFFDSPTPEIVATGAHLCFPKTATPWPNEGLRRASINSFGFGGANVHLVLDDALHYSESISTKILHNTSASPSVTTFANRQNEVNVPDDNCPKEDVGPQLLVMSAADKNGIDRYRALLTSSYRYVALSDINQDFVADLAYTLSEKRTHLAWRGFALASDVEDLIQSMALNKIPVIKTKAKPNLAFIFTGQGANWPMMGKQLKVFPVFAESLAQAEIQFKKLGATWSLEEELELPKDSSRIHFPEFSQPICTAVQVALVDLLRDWRVLPHVVVGHSSGEIAAAYSTGAISRSSAWTIAFCRGAAIRALSKAQKNLGGMMAVGLSKEDADKYIAQLYVSDQKIDIQKLSVACINSYNSVTVSGLSEYLDALQLVLEKEGVFCRRLNINVAYHSPAMHEISQLYHQMIESLESGKSYETSPIMVSTVTGRIVAHTELQKPEYWVQNLVSPVLFKQAIAQLQLGSKTAPRTEKQISESQILPSVDLVIEIGPHSALKGPLRNIFATTCPGVEFPYVPLLARESCGLQTILTAAGTLFQTGVKLDLLQVNSSRLKSASQQRRMLIDLPPYVFNHTHKYWAEGRLSKNYRFRQFPAHELLGHQVLDWNSSAARWQNFISLSSHPWVEHHKVAGAYIYPAAGMISMAIEASRQLNTKKTIKAFRFKDVSIVKALIIPETGTVETQFSMEKCREQNDPFSIWYKFTFFLHEETTFTQLSYGTLGVEIDGQSSLDEVAKTNIEYSLQSMVKQNCWKRTSSKAFYDLCKDHGLHYGESFLGLDDLYMDLQDCARATTDLDHWKKSVDSTKYQPHVVHPAALDAVLQLALVALNQMKPGFPVAVPTRLQDIWISSAILDDPNHISAQSRPTKLDVFGQAKYTGFRNAFIEMGATDSRNGDLVIRCRGFCTTVDDRRFSSSSAGQAKTPCYSLEWRPDFDCASAAEVKDYCSMDALPKLVETREAIIQPLALCYLSAQRALREVDGLALNELSSKYAGFLKKCLDNINTELEPQMQAELSRELDNQEYFVNLCNTVEALTPEGMLVSRIARNMKELLLDQINVVELLFSDNTMSAYYQYSVDTDTGFCKLRKWMDAYSHKYPSCRLLEIGAGTGASSAHILEFLKGPSVQRFEEYMFTDISAGFFDKAKDALAKYGQSVQFATLDIEKDPETQGHKLAHYDIVTATNVLHATKDIRKTLMHARSLLQPDGKLVITEIINGTGLLPGFVVGFFPGWWLAKEPERCMSPLISESQWTTALLDAGFSGIDISFSGYRGEKHATSTMISSVRKESVPRLVNGVYSQPIRIIISPQSKLQAELALELQHQLDSTCIVEHFDSLPQNFEAVHTIFLPSLEDDVLQTATSLSFSTLTNLLSRSRNFLWVYSTQLLTEDGPVNEAITGFARSAMTEQPHNTIKLLGLDRLPNTLSDSIQEITKLILRVKEQKNSTRYNDYQSTYLEKDGLLHVNRLQSLAEMADFISNRTNPHAPQPIRLGSQCLRVDIATPGLLDTLHFVNNTVQDDHLEEDEILIAIKACGINFKDLLLAVGKMQGRLFGWECSGVVIAAGAKSPLMVGDRVSCFTKGCMGTHVRCKSMNAIRIPSWMSFNQGASWTTSFTSAYYALVHKAQISEGEQVLIHSGAGALGQACIQIAKLYGAEIFTTVGNHDKAQFLIDRYGIPADHIFDSRNSKFEYDVMAATQNQGVDIVVNSVTGELLQASLRCIGSFGRFIETGKRDIQAGNSLPLSVFEKSVTFFAMDIALSTEQKPALTANILAKLLDLFDQGKLQILNTITYPLSKVEDGFRDLSSGNTIGKIVLELSEDDIMMTVSPTLIPWRFPKEATYVIVGGLGGIGRSLARWMSGRGATHLILLGRKGVHNQEGQDLITELERMGTKVVAPACDVSVATELQDVLAKFSEFPPIKGCIQGAMVLDNIAFKSMSVEAYKKVASPRIKGSWNLHNLLPSGMDFFIMLSSLSGVVGGHGQANYASTNTYLDGLAHYRNMKGENAVSLDIGKVLQVGYVAEGKEIVNDFLMNMFPGLLEKELHALFEFYCQPSTDGVNRGAELKQSQIMIGIDSPDVMRARGQDIALWFMEQALFRQLLQVKADSNIISNEGEDTKDISSILAKAPTFETAVEAIVQGFATKLERTLGLAAQDFDESNALQKFGIDSLSAVELRTWLRMSVGADIPVFDLVSEKSIAQLANQAATISSFVPVTLKTTTQQVNGVAA